jgi:paraquat-inducible protein A
MSTAIEQDPSPVLVCRYCGQTHRSVPLRPRQRALCTRCHSLLALGSARSGSAFAWAVAGLALLSPALMMPFASVSKIGHDRIQHLFGGVQALWQHGLSVLSTWVFICGVVAPALLLALVASVSVRGVLDENTRRGARKLAAALEHWAMPEVQVLAVLIAMTKLGTLVNVHLGPGFWCYGAMAVALLVSWRKFELQPTPEATAAAGNVQPSS